LKYNSLKKIKKEFAVKRLKSQPIFIISFKPSILISCTTILKPHL